MSSGARGGARAEGNGGQVLVASERTIQPTCGPALSYAAAGPSPRPVVRRDRPSSVRRRRATMEANTLTASTYMAALGAASDGVLMIDREGVILYANPAAESFFCDEGLPGQFVADLTPLDRRTLSVVFRALRRTRRWSGRLCVRSASPEL